MKDIQSIISAQRHYFQSGKTQSCNFRRLALLKLASVIHAHEEKIIEALRKDFGKGEFETYETEIGIVYDEIRFYLKKLKKWMKPKRVPTPFIQFPAMSYIHREPRGNTLLIAPWNYPFALVMSPLLGAIAGGNTTIIKPSEFTTHTANVIEEIINNNFDSGFLCVIQGGIEVSTELLNNRFDYIFFTGSPQVGKIVMREAAKFLTPVTLELGGKSPCIVDETAKIKVSARRIAWGKLLNASQTCVAPDYLLVHKNILSLFLEELKLQISKMHPDVMNNPDFPQMVNERNFHRLESYLKETKGEIIYGGECDLAKRKIAPTLVLNPSFDEPLMQEEIFGPILPVLTYDSFEELQDIISRNPDPLALYVFSLNKKFQQRVVENIPFGGGAINETIMHLATPHLPFGGRGTSGMGQYHGKAGFDTFTHAKSVLKKSTMVDIPVRYAPYKGKLGWLKFFLK